MSASPQVEKLQPTDSPWRERFQSWLQHVLTRLEAACDRVNPILVKETRQALKSRQFVVTLLIVLVACWAASFAVVAIIGPDVYYIASGSQMLFVYAVILAVPLILIVPFSAFRSLAAEQEDNTYDLLSITTLTPQQIITGKLGSAAVQMLVYLSAISPCIAFTYLLRGVDTPTIVFMLIYAVALSMGLSVIGLLAGTNSKAKHMQVLLSILLLLFQILILSSVISELEDFINRGVVDIRQSGFWTSNFLMASFYLALFALLHAAAAAQICFTSENRSTPLRIRFLILLACVLGWAVAGLWRTQDSSLLNEGFMYVAAISVIALHTVGMLTTSEWPHISRRAQRGLPKSALGRVLLTWLNPGPNTGYVFSVATLTAVNGTLLMLALLLDTIQPSPFTDHTVYFAVLSWCYSVLFLGVGKMLVAAVRTVTYVQLSAGFLLHLVLLLIACGVPQVIFLMTPSLRMGDQFSFLQISNPVWTLYALTNLGPLAIDAHILVFLLVPLAVAMLVWQCRSVAIDIGYLPRALPERVALDDKALHPVAAPRPLNPWDEAAGADAATQNDATNSV